MSKELLKELPLLVLTFPVVVLLSVTVFAVVLANMAILQMRAAFSSRDDGQIYD